MKNIVLTEELSISQTLDNESGIEEIKGELQKTVDFSKALSITDFEDKKQFELVKSTKNGYVKTRNTIERAFKSKRDFYNQKSKENLEAQREVIAVIEAEEKRLDEMVQKAELLKLRKDNEKVIEDRIEALAKCETIVDREVLLSMKEKDFENLLTESRLAFVKKEEERLEAERQRIAREKELEEAKKQAKIEAEQEAQRQAEIEKQRVENERIESDRKHKEEIERLKKEQEAKELAEKQKKEAEEQAKLEAEERLAKETKYRDFLTKNEGKYDKIIKEDGKVVLYKAIDTFII